MTRLYRPLLALLLLALIVGPSTAAGQTAKVPLSHDVYDAWRSIRGQKLSDDGKWVLYAELPQEGDAELVVRSLVTDTEYRQGLGWLTSGGGFGVRVDAEFSADARHVVFLASPPIDAVKAARKDKKKPDQLPKKTLGIIDLSDGSAARVERVKSFKLPEDAGTMLAYLLEKPLPADEDEEESEAPAPEAKAEPAQPKPVAETAEGKEAEKDEKKDKKKDYGTDLALRDLATGAETRIGSALAYLLTDDGAALLYTVSSKESPETDGAYALDVATGSSRALLQGEGNYERLTVDDSGRRVAFVSDVNDYAAEEPTFELFGAAVSGAGAAEAWVSHRQTAAMPDGFAVSNKEAISFVADASAIVFGIKERPKPKPEEESADEERAQFDLWHWNDPYPQPAQLLRADDVRNEAFESIYWIDEGTFVQLADEDLPDLEVSDNGALAMGTSDRAWAKQASYEGFFNDVIVVDPKTGDRTTVAERVSYGVRMSPDGRYVAWFGGVGDWIGYDDNGGGGWSGGQDWFLYDASTGSRRNLTDGLDAEFERVDWDTPNLPAPYGSAGFTTGDTGVLVYDRFDPWYFPTDDGAPVRLTEGIGRQTHTSFRYVKLDPDEDGVPGDRPILLSGTDAETMATSFWVDRIGSDETPTRLIGAEARLSFRDLADDGDAFLFDRQTFSEFPDLWVGRLQLGGDLEADDDAPYALSNVRKITDLGSQTDPFIWGKAELRQFRSSDGVPLKGILIKPEDFDPERRYPLMVYIYETLHQGLHSFRNPAPGTSINPSYYVSNGYVLWMPDIEYVTPGYPGKDALKCILPGINMLVSEGFIDADNIGIQGHSWGGYQIAYMVTQTDIFKAAESGAPVSNMTSAYGGIRWGSGLVREFQYERTQSRLGASLWQVPLRYVENSPIFWVDKIHTPLLILHNDKDGAVPWYQGIEFIMALRRLHKEAYMFNYNGEPHGLRKRVNQKDYTVRMQEFFDHELRGAPAPEWMTRGIRGWEKGHVDR